MGGLTRIQRSALSESASRGASLCEGGQGRKKTKLTSLMGKARVDGKFYPVRLPNRVWVVLVRITNSLNHFLERVGPVVICIPVSHA